MPDLGELRTNLVFAPRLETDLHDTFVRARPDRVISQSRSFGTRASLAAGLHEVRAFALRNVVRMFGVACRTFAAITTSYAPASID